MLSCDQLLRGWMFITIHQQYVFYGRSFYIFMCIHDFVCLYSGPVAVLCVWWIQCCFLQGEKKEFCDCNLDLFDFFFLHALGMIYACHEHDAHTQLRRREDYFALFSGRCFGSLHWYLAVVLMNHWAVYRSVCSLLLFFVYVRGGISLSGILVLLSLFYQ